MNRASRVASKASSGFVLASASTWAHANGADIVRQRGIFVNPLGQFEIKGVASLMELVECRLWEETPHSALLLPTLMDLPLTLELGSDSELGHNTPDDPPPPSPAAGDVGAAMGLLAFEAPFFGLGSPGGYNGRPPAGGDEGHHASESPSVGGSSAPPTYPLGQLVGLGSAQEDPKPLEPQAFWSNSSGAALPQQQHPGQGHVLSTLGWTHQVSSGPRASADFSNLKESPARPPQVLPEGINRSVPLPLMGGHSSPQSPYRGLLSLAPRPNELNSGIRYQTLSIASPLRTPAMRLSETDGPSRPYPMSSRRSPVSAAGSQEVLADAGRMMSPDFASTGLKPLASGPGRTFILPVFSPSSGLPLRHGDGNM